MLDLFNLFEILFCAHGYGVFRAVEFLLNFERCAEHGCCVVEFILFEVHGAEVVASCGDAFVIGAEFLYEDEYDVPVEGFCYGVEPACAVVAGEVADAYGCCFVFVAKMLLADGYGAEYEGFGFLVALFGDEDCCEVVEGGCYVGVLGAVLGFGYFEGFTEYAFGFVCFALAEELGCLLVEFFPCRIAFCRCFGSEDKHQGKNREKAYGCALFAGHRVYGFFL